MLSDAEIAEAYIKRYETDEDSAEREALFWVFEEISDISWHEPERCFDIILLILERTKSDSVMEILSAGPLEDILSKHGLKIIDRVEAEAKRNSAFVSLLEGVWRNSMSQEIWDRVVQIRDRRGWDGIPK